MKEVVTDLASISPFTDRFSGRTPDCGSGDAISIIADLTSISFLRRVLAWGSSGQLYFLLDSRPSEWKGYAFACPERHPSVYPQETRKYNLALRGTHRTANRRTLFAVCAWTVRAAHRQSASSPSSKCNQGGQRARAGDVHPKVPKRSERGGASRLIIIDETSRFRVRARQRPIARHRLD